MPDSVNERSTTASTAEILKRVEALAPLIEGQAAASEDQGHLTDLMVESLHGQKMFRLLLPKPYGGEEVTPATFMQAIEAVAQLDASTAWCLCQQNGCSMSAAIADPDIAALIWGDDPAGALTTTEGPGRSRARDTRRSGIDDGRLVDYCRLYAPDCVSYSRRSRT